MKRAATSKLTHENWDQEEEVEDRGTFAKAAETVTTTRKTLCAKRKTTGITVGAGNVFKGFSGFSKVDCNGVSMTNESNFNDNKIKRQSNIRQLNKVFLENIQKYITKNAECILTPLFDDYSKHWNRIKETYPIDVSEKITVSIPQTTTTGESEPVKMQAPFSLFSANSNLKEDSTKFSESNAGFTSLFSSTTPSTVAPTFSFSASNTSAATKPLFSTTTFAAASNSNTTVTPLFSTTPSAAASTLSFAASYPSTTSTSADSNSLFSFSNKSDNAKPLFSFNASSSNNTPAVFAPFPAPTFGAGAPTFAVGAPKAVNEEDDEYVPPKPETKDIQEEGSVYEMRCKLFYKKNDQWKEKGVGNIFIKPTDDKKFQLVMRADNNLGTILLNILVTSQMPLAVNKNNVSLVAMTDLIDGKEIVSTSLLIRVKTEDKANELLEMMKKQTN